MSQSLKIKLKSFDHSVLDKTISSIMALAKSNGVKSRGPIPLPSKKEIFTILRATHKYKDSREQFERITYSRLIYILNPNNDFVTALDNLAMPNGISVEIKV